MKKPPVVWVKDEEIAKRFGLPLPLLKHWFDRGLPDPTEPLGTLRLDAQLKRPFGQLKYAHYMHPLDVEALREHPTVVEAINEARAAKGSSAK